MKRVQLNISNNNENRSSNNINLNNIIIRLIRSDMINKLALF